MNSCINTGLRTALEYPSLNTKIVFSWPSRLLGFASAVPKNACTSFLLLVGGGATDFLVGKRDFSIY
jgi:hypothetical protein